MSSETLPRLRPRSLRARLTFWYLLTLACALVALAAFVFLAQARTSYHELDRDLELRLIGFAGERRAALLSLDVAGALADEAGPEMPVLVRQASGGVIHRSPGFPSLDGAGEREAAAAAREGTPLLTVADRFGDRVRLATLVMHRPGAENLALQLATSIAPVRRDLARLGLGMAMFMTLVLVLASYGGSFIARRALAPVDEVVRRVRSIQAARISERLEVRTGSDEIDGLVVTLNEMLDRIEASIHSARRFAADASHELQTPLAAMRGAVEMCTRAERSPAEYRALAADVLAETERLSTLIRDLRLLALADRGEIQATGDVVDLAALALECCEIANAMAEEKDIRVETSIRGRPAVLGSPLHLRRIVLNLLQNAIRYSPASSRVVLTVGRPKGHGMVMVSDHGCGIDSEDLPHIFEPFYRADPARARDTGGSGLGLAIVGQIVRLHRGTIKVASVPGRGSTFAVYLPSAPGPGGSDSPSPSPAA